MQMRDPSSVVLMSIARRQRADSARVRARGWAVGPRADADADGDAVILDAHAQQAIGDALCADADRSRKVFHDWSARPRPHARSGIMPEREPRPSRQGGK